MPLKFYLILILIFGQLCFSNQASAAFPLTIPNDTVENSRAINTTDTISKKEKNRPLNSFLLGIGGVIAFFGGVAVILALPYFPLLALCIMLWAFGIGFAVGAVEDGLKALFKKQKRKGLAIAGLALGSLVLLPIIAAGIISLVR